MVSGIVSGEGESTGGWSSGVHQRRIVVHFLQKAITGRREEEEVLVSDSGFLVTKGEIERAGYTYSDLDENGHLRILLIFLLPLVPFECTVLS